MRKILMNKKVVVVLMVLTIISFVFYEYMIARPISYGMSYYTSTEYEGEVFKSAVVFHSDGTMVTKNTTFETEIRSYYYNKGGYHFLLSAQTEDAFTEEKEWIDANFEEALAMPFYAYKINAFKLTGEGPDGYKVVYKCYQSIVFAVAGGVFELAMISFTLTLWIARKRKKRMQRMSESNIQNT